MGCNGSKSTQVQQLGPDGEVISRKSSASKKKKNGFVEVKPGVDADVMDNTDSNPDGVRVLKDTNMGSRDSLGSHLDKDVDNKSQDRLVSSATSKFSQRTFDSGLESDYGHVITEYSHPNMVEDRPETPDLVISGTKCESRKSSGLSKGREKTRNPTTAEILGELKSQGIISTSATAPQHAPKKGGTSFDVMIAIDFDELKKPPPRLAKLKKRKKKKSSLTKEEVDAKLRAAEERRIAKQSKLREKLDTMKKEAQVHKVVEETEDAQKKQVEVKINDSLSQAAKNREAHFQALRERLEQKKRHAEKVRQARMERMAAKQARGEGEEEVEEKESEKQEEEEVSAV